MKQDSFPIQFLGDFLGVTPGAYLFWKLQSLYMIVSKMQCKCIPWWQKITGILMVVYILIMIDGSKIEKCQYLLTLLGIQ